MAKPSLSIFTGDKTLGTVFREQNQINSKFFEANIPFSSTTGRTAFQWGGKTRIIMVQGAQSGTGFDGATQEIKLSDFIYEIEQWINARVQTSIVYTDSFGNTYNVHCADWSWVRGIEDPNRILYTLMLKEV